MNLAKLCYLILYKYFNGGVIKPKTEIHDSSTLSVSSGENMTAEDIFMRNLEEFRSRFCNGLTNEDVDELFVRDKTIYSGIRHPEDFED